MTNRPGILLAEDEKHLAAGISYNLEKRGYHVEIARRGDDALAAAMTKAFDLIILDVMMPGLDGFAVCKELRNRKNLTPILMLTARHETENRVHGLRAGADDYLGKPFDLEELLGRVEALLRRRKWDDRQAGEVTLFKIGPVEFDANLLQLRKESRVRPLTAMESKLLVMLVTERGRTVSRSQILKRVWGLHEHTQTRTLDNFIMRLRHHLEEVGGESEWIESVRGVGYRFVGPQEDNG